LLRLIEREELDITTIALAHVADHYLAHVRSLEHPEPQALAEFVSLAARLLLIKSRVLLPRPAAHQRTAPADPDAETLAEQLRLYRRYQQVALLLNAQQERASFPRPVPLTFDDHDRPPPTVTYTPADLLAALQRRRQLALPVEAVALLSLGPRLTVGEVSRRIKRRLATQAWFCFDDLLDPFVSREAVAVLFWALLELLKRRVIIVEQDQLFGQITIGRVVHAHGEWLPMD
jgi:segregation and condensation protein A